MFDSAWDGISGEVAHEIETLNYSNQVNVIQALVLLILHQVGCDETGCTQHPSERALKELHRTGTIFLLDRPGEYREEPVHVSTPDGTIVHQPPPHAEIPQHMETFFNELGIAWPQATAIQLAAYSLWKLNWIHPFKNGNGRTARAFCYAVLCLKLGFVLPGAPTVIDQIMMKRAEYQAALKAADVSFESGGALDLTLMIQFLEGLLIVQLEAVGPEAPPVVGV